MTLKIFASSILTTKDEQPNMVFGEDLMTIPAALYKN